jgi:hypothetical protein
VLLPGEDYRPGYSSALLMYIPAKVGQGSTLANKVINQKIIRYLEIAFKNGWKSETMVAISSGVRDPIQLTDSTLQREAKIVREPLCKNSRNCVHPRRLQSMYRQQSGLGIPNQPPDRSHIRY